MKIKPFGKQILIRPVKKEQVLVSDSDVLCEYGECVAVGEDVINIKVGDWCGYEVWGTKTLEIDGQKNYFISEDSDFLLCTIEK